MVSVYKILKCKYSDVLSHDVNTHLEQGFDIVGQPFFHRHSVCQAVLFKDTKQKKSETKKNISRLTPSILTT